MLAALKASHLEQLNHEAFAWQSPNFLSLKIAH
ncbi:hypothetical protein PP2015_105 [Pseudoalteromonas phenolica]|uniref:Uncharacterized protein n=1 Tax=Pseudoalteromonas phenolica TaxID=161398 RepID=A0A0S2JX95_9GAMM|nr:hypothetical protein PP2015_105 [Pseudoalteromonas phenolica]